jgi:hypothetical protein
MLVHVCVSASSLVACSTQQVCRGQVCASCLLAGPSEQPPPPAVFSTSLLSALHPSLVTCPPRDIRNQAARRTFESCASPPPRLSLPPSPHSTRDYPTATDPTATRRSSTPSERASSLRLAAATAPSSYTSNLAYSHHTTSSTTPSTTTAYNTLSPAKPPPNAAGLATSSPSDSSFFRLRQPHSGDQIPRNLNVLRTHSSHYTLPQLVVSTLAPRATLTHHGQQLLEGLGLAQHCPSEQRAHFSKSAILTSQP